MDFPRPISGKGQDDDAKSSSSFQSTVSVQQDGNMHEEDHSIAKNSAIKLMDGNNGLIISDDDDSYFTDAEIESPSKMNFINDEKEEMSPSFFSNQQYRSDDLPYPGFIPVIFGCLSQTSQPRRLLLRIITNPWFERISMLVIILNCVTLAMYRPCHDEMCDDERCQALKVNTLNVNIFLGLN